MVRRRQSDRGRLSAAEPRRSPLQFLLGSPLALASAPLAALDSLLGAEAEELITRARDAIHVFDFEAVARQELSPAHWTFLSMDVQHEVTLRANRSAFARREARGSHLTAPTYAWRRPRPRFFR